MVRAIRVLVAKIGLDGHDRGAKVLARAMRDGGLEVIYTGIKQTPEDILHAAIEEDVDCIALSILSGAHMTLCEDLVKRIKKNKASFLLVCGGIIPDDDVAKLKKLGFAGVFGPGTKLNEAVGFIKSHVR